MQESYWVNPPRNILVHKQRRQQSQTCYVMNKKCFLTNCLSSIDKIFNYDIEYVKNDCQDEKYSAKIISPKLFVHVWIFESHNAGNHKGRNHDHISVDPNII
jgi:hypothetical protein